MFSCKFSLFQRQSKLDKVAGRTGEADGLGGIPVTQPPLTTPLERRDIPPRLSMTLKHIVGQLDVLTQVSCGKFCEQGICFGNQEPWGGGGVVDGGCTPVSDLITLPFVGENTRG